jgi:flagellar hook-associated protein 1 FlgK
LSSLDQLAYNVSTQVNALNNGGTDLDGVSGTVANPLYIFNQPTAVAGSAANMSVAMTDPSQIAAAGLGKGTGDNTNATAMANLANQSIVNGQTPTDYFSNFVSTLGATVSSVQTENTAQNASVTQLQTQNNALSGVNLDDEASAMSTLERSYQAASQVFTMLNTIMASALNLGEQATVS